MGLPLLFLSSKPHGRRCLDRVAQFVQLLATIDRQTRAAVRQGPGLIRDMLVTLKVQQLLQLQIGEVI